MFESSPSTYRHICFTLFSWISKKGSCPNPIKELEQYVSARNLDFGPEKKRFGVSTIIIARSSPPDSYIDFLAGEQLKEGKGCY